MNKAFEKIMEQLTAKENEAVLKAPYDVSSVAFQKWMMKSYGFKEAREIVQEAAKEYEEQQNIPGNDWTLFPQQPPECDGTYICTCKGIEETITLLFSTYDNTWMDEYGAEYDDVIAWRKMPTRYINQE